MNTALKTGSALLLFLLLCGCIHDGFENCPKETGTTLFFRYYGDGSRDIFPDRIGKVTLYLYDNSDGSLKETITLDNNQLHDQKTQLDLPAGDYHAVAWGNFYPATEAKNTGRLSTGIVGVSDYFSGKTVRTNDSLYFGDLDFIIPGNTVVNDTVFFRSAHIKMVLDLVDLKEEAIVEGISPISFRVSGLSPITGFDGKVSGEKTAYYPIAQPEGDDFIARFSTLRFQNTDDIRIDLFYGSSTEPMYTLDLPAYLAEHDITVDGINEITIGIRFIFTGTSVRVENWVENNIVPGR